MRTLNLFKALVFMLLVSFGAAAPAATVTGSATMDAFGSPVPVAAEGATVRLCLTMHGAPLNCFLPLQTVTVGESGTYSLNSNAGTFVLQAIFPGTGLLYASSIEFTGTDQVITRNIFLEVQTYTITGKVSGAGVGIPGSTVELRFAGQTAVKLSSTTDADGDYSFLDVPNGSYDITAKPPVGLLYSTETVAGQLIDNSSTSVDFALQTNFSIAGTVTGGGVALPGAEVALYLPGEGSAGGDTPVANRHHQHAG
jgi:hypothetical protein